MQGLSRTTIIGNLGQDPELRYTQSGTPVLSLRIAVNTSFKDRADEWRERAEWFGVVVWGKRGEALNKILSKGQGVYVEGEMRSRSYETRDGSKRVVWELAASELLLLGDRERRADQTERAGHRASQSSQPQQEFCDDEIPF